LLTNVEHHKQADKLSDEASALLPKLKLQEGRADAWRQWQEKVSEFQKYLSAPTLSFDIINIDPAGGCAGVIIADVQLALKPSTIIATNTLIPYPLFSIWSQTRSLK